jgi:hypothetical protein
MVHFQAFVKIVEETFPKLENALTSCVCAKF